MNNYDKGDVSALNEWGIEVVLADAPEQPSPAETFLCEKEVMNMAFKTIADAHTDIRNAALEEAIKHIMRNLDETNWVRRNVAQCINSLKSQPAQPSDTELSAQDKFVVIQTLIPALKKAGVTVTGSVKEGWKVKVSPTQPSDTEIVESFQDAIDAYQDPNQSWGISREYAIATVRSIKAAMRAEWEGK